MRVSPTERELKTRSPAVPLLILVILIAGFLFRSWFSAALLPPPPRMQGETTQALRYSSMISSGEDIPAVDTRVMHPGGMITSENSIFEEYIAGGLHRMVGGDLHTFLRFFCLFFPLLAVPGLYLWMKSAGIGTAQALSASAFYTFLLPALLRTRGESLYRETVALPMLILLGWLVESSLRPSSSPRRLVYPLSAGAALFLALAAWKVTAFLSVFLFIYLIWRDRSEASAVPDPLKLSLGASQLAASLLLSHMRHDTAYIGPAAVLAIFLCVSVLTGRRKWMPWTAMILAGGITLLGPGSTGHVGAVILAKLRFLFRHPSDPTMLSDSARLFWVSGYTSPTSAQMLLLFGIPVAAALPGLRSFIREQRGTLLFWFLPLSLAGYLFFDRLHVLLAVALVPVIARSVGRSRVIAALAAALLLAQSLLPVRIASALSDAGLRMRDDASLLSEREVGSLLLWLQRETAPDDAVLSFWHLSGLISAYAERPVVTHTFFENEDNRNTIVRFARTMFMPEDSLLRFMDQRECDLVVYQADFLLDRSHSGLLYLAGMTEVPDGSAAHLMHSDPGSLDSLNLLFQGHSLRVFGRMEVPSEQLDRSFLFEERYMDSAEANAYDNARLVLSYPLEVSGLMADSGVELPDPDMLSGALLLALGWDGPPEVAGQMLNDLIQMYIQGIYGLDGLAEDIASFQHHLGRDPQLGLLLARLYAAEGRFDDARAEYELLLQLDPGLEEAITELGMIEGRGDE